jgi:SAM-dependent methyltransferase
MNPYPILYRLGITPWEREESPRQLRELVEGLPGQPGRALDIGCGTGRDAVYLAQQGWSVTGVDAVPQAIDAARRRAQAAGVAVSWILDDVTRLESLNLDGPFALLVDRGCFHGLSDDERERCVRGATTLATPEAQLLMFAFQPRRIGLGPRGITRRQLERHFAAGWELTSSEPDPEARLPFWIGNANPTWYRLRRRS